MNVKSVICAICVVKCEKNWKYSGREDLHEAVNYKKEKEMSRIFYITSDGVYYRAVLRNPSYCEPLSSWNF